MYLPAGNKPDDIQTGFNLLSVFIRTIPYYLMFSRWLCFLFYHGFYFLSLHVVNINCYIRFVF